MMDSACERSLDQAAGVVVLVAGSLLALTVGVTVVVTVTVERRVETATGTGYFELQ